MSANWSTGAHTANLTDISDRLLNFVIECYSGARPVSADSAPTGTFLGRITQNGQPFVAGSAANGLNLTQLTQTSFGKPDGANWRFIGESIGTIGWVRVKANAVDNNGASTTLYRIDIPAGTSPAVDMIAFTSLASAVGGSIDISSFILSAA